MAIISLISDETAPRTTTEFSHEGPSVVAAVLVVIKSDFFVDTLLVRIHFIIVMVRWTGLAPWEFDFPSRGSLTSTFQGE